MGLKKILHITFDMRIGGAERVIYNLVENTDRSKYETSILCIDQPIGPFGSRLREIGYEIDMLNRKPGFDLGLVRQVRAHILQKGIDVVHCHQYTPYVYGLLASAFSGKRVIFTEHGRFYPDQRKTKRILLNPIFARFTDHIVAISEATRNALVEFENFPKKKIRVIYNGIKDVGGLSSGKPDQREKLGIAGNAFVLGTVARLDSIKNQKMMIKALKMIQSEFPNTFLVIVGDGPERKNLKELAAKLKLEGSVIFTGFREDTNSFYNIMDVFLLTSYSEGTAMTLLEAMAAKLPCIVTDVGGNPEIVKAEETGFIIPSDNEEALAEKILILQKNIGLRADMGKAGRKRFEERFTVRSMVRDYEQLYDKMSTG